MRSAQALPVSCVVAMLIHGLNVQAADQADDDSGSEELFTLGQVTVIGERIADDTSNSTVSADEIWKFDANTLTEAVKLAPGVTGSMVSNGRRNEGDISVRGFDRWRVPLSIDGIRVYLPADNRIDFNRFLTPDLGEVQIRKSYASVLDGPGAMGGAINLVTRKPTKPFEAEVQGGASFDRKGDYEGWTGTAIVGMRQDNWYAQTSGSQLKRDHWTLSKDFAPLGPAEDGGERQGSGTKDWRINLKTGWTPNETDEYSLSFTRQKGEKSAPLATNFLLANGTVNTAAGYQANNYWTWPYWEVQSIYFLSHTQLTDAAYLKTRLFYNEFDNLLSAWDDINYATQSANGRFNSYYNDSGAGGSVELGNSFLPNSTTRAAFHYRRDRHREFNDNRPTAPQRMIEPAQHSEEKTWSLALQHDWAASDVLDVVAGISYDHNERTQAQEYGTPNALPGFACVSGTAPCLFNQPLGKDNAFNWQGAAHWTYVPNAKVGASISSRSRFPNNFERYSTRFGTARANPDLGTERAVHYELNWESSVTDAARVTAAVFYDDIQDMIQTVIVQNAPQITQTQNVGDGCNYGAEFAVDWTLLPQLRVGANYAYLDRKVEDPVPANLEPTGVPDHLGFAYAAWMPIPTLTIQPSLEFAGNRWTDQNGSATLAYTRIGRYKLTNLQVTWRPTGMIEAVIGARNLFDKNFEIAYRLPEPGRSLFTKVRIRF